MPGSWRRDTDHGFATEVRRRLDALERRRFPKLDPNQPEPIVFSLAGDVEVSESGPYIPRHNRKLASVMAVLGTAGSSSTVVSINKNGVSLDTITLGSGEDVEAITVSEYFAIGADKLSVEVTTAGTGAVDLTVQCEFLVS